MGRPPRNVTPCSLTSSRCSRRSLPCRSSTVKECVSSWRDRVRSCIGREEAVAIIESLNESAYGGRLRSSFDGDAGLPSPGQSKERLVFSRGERSMSRPRTIDNHHDRQSVDPRRSPKTAAIFARKSTLQYGTDAEAKSVAIQIANARTFAGSKGWAVNDAHIYSDDAVSGAETRKLVNRQRMLDAIRNGPPFDVLIVRDSSRLSRRDGDEAFSELKAIAKAGVAIWFY